MAKNKKGQAIGNLGGLITTLAAVAILVSVIFLIMAETRTQITTVGGCDNATAVYNATQPRGCYEVDGLETGLSSALNATETTILATSDIPGWLPIIIITIIGGILLTLVRFFRSQ